jgi:hypothetical protein
MKRTTPPLFTPDLIVEKDGIEFLYSLWGYRRGERVVSIGANHSEEIKADRLRQVKDDNSGRNNRDARRLDQ